MTDKNTTKQAKPQAKPQAEPNMTPEKAKQIGLDPAPFGKVKE